MIGTIMFKRSSHFAVDVKPADYERAVDFYTKTFGLKVNERTENRAYLEGSNFGLFVVKSETPGVDQEFMTDNLDRAREHFEKAGCTIVHWKGPGKSNRVIDPFGLIFNVWLEDPK